jgi:hypothetical protein
MSTEGGTKAVIAALLANSGIAVSKFVAFVITGSTSMLSEAIHSVADALNQVLLLIGGKRSKRVADEKSARVRKGVYQCGDHCGIASIDTALASGTAAAEAILDDTP